MSYGVELLNKDGKVVAGPIGLVALGAVFAEKLIGSTVKTGEVKLLLNLVPSEGNDLSTDPPLRYASPIVGFAQVFVGTSGRYVYRHPHLISEIVEPGLREWIEAHGPDLDLEAYRITGPEIPSAYREAPKVEGMAEIRSPKQREARRFRIRPIPPPPPPLSTLEALGAANVGSDWTGENQTRFVKVVLDSAAHDDLAERLPFSDEVEEGGFLVGRIFEDQDEPETFISQITEVLPAKATGASLLHFTFTADSFGHVKEEVEREHPGQVILGWYHTHLFEATDDFGLSTIDYRLHFNTFRIPWQIAGLVNIHEGRRVLRFYVPQEREMALCSYQAVPQEQRA